MEEQVLHNSSLAHVTPTAVYLKHETIQVSNIGGVSIDTDIKWNPVAVLIAVAGIISCAFFSKRVEFLFLGITLVAIGLIIQRFWPLREVKLRIKFTSGVSVLTSDNPKLMNELKRAIEYSFSLQPYL